MASMPALTPSMMRWALSGTAPERGLEILCMLLLFTSSPPSGSPRLPARGRGDHFFRGQLVVIPVVGMSAATPGRLLFGVLVHAARGPLPSLARFASSVATALSLHRTRAC